MNIQFKERFFAITVAAVLAGIIGSLVGLAIYRPPSYLVTSIIYPSPEFNLLDGNAVYPHWEYDGKGDCWHIDFRFLGDPSCR